MRCWTPLTTDDDAVGAAAQALCYEAPTGWRDDSLRAFKDRQHLTPVLARVSEIAAFRPKNFSCDQARGEAPGSGAPSWRGRWAALAPPPPYSLLRSLLDDDDGHVCEAAAIALMRLGDD